MLGCSILILIVPVFALAPPQEAYAASRTWDGGGDGEQWWDCDNWSGNECPEGTDSMKIRSGANVFVDGFRLLSGGSLTVNSGATLTLQSETGEFWNNGTIHNSGMIFVRTDDHDYYFRNFHAINNDGTIINIFGFFSNEPSGTIQNNAGGTIVGGMENYGTIVNGCGGTYEPDLVVYGDPVVSEPCTTTSPCDNPTIVGTDGNDIIDGTPGADTIIAKGGDDTINGLGGNDLICGGGGNDSISGGSGSDLIFGGHGNDIINGGLGSDMLNGGGGYDSLDGNGGNDTLVGSSGNDTLNGKDGEAGRNELLYGGLGTDTCHHYLGYARACEAF